MYGVYLWIMMMAACRGQPPVETGAGAAEVVPPAAAAPAEGARPGAMPGSVEELLDALEASDGAMASLTAEILYDRVFEIQGDRQIRRGSVYFRDRGALPSGGRDRVFAAKFTSLQVGDRYTEEAYHLVFDGVTLVERWPAQKQFVKTQLARAGERADALRVGKNPLPLPLGQKKADILVRYTAAMPAVEDGATANVEAETPAIRAFVAGCVQLHLTIRPELAKSEEVHEVRVWYRRDGALLLPRLVRAVNRAGDVSLVQLAKVKANGEIPAEAIDMATPTEGWDVQVRELPAPAAKAE